MYDSLLWLGKLIPDKNCWAWEKARVPEGASFLAKVVFDLDQTGVKIELAKYVEENASDYRWRGNAPRASNEPVWVLTVSDIKYIKLDEDGRNNIRNLLEKLRDVLSNAELTQLLTQFHNLEHVKKLSTMLAEIDDKILSDGAGFNEKVDEELKQRYVKPKQVVLYTVCVRKNGNLVELAKEDAYLEVLKLFLMTCPDPKRIKQGSCHVCGKAGAVLDDPAFLGGSLLKIYVIDKKGFASGVSSDGWARTFAICPECKVNLTNAWEYVRRNLTTRLAPGLYVHVIPYAKVGRPGLPFEKMAKLLNGSFNSICSYEALQGFEKEFSEYLRYEHGQEWYSLSLVFSTGVEGQHFKLNHFMQQVPLTRLKQIRETLRELASEVKERFGWSFEDWYVGLSNIAKTFPLRADRSRKPISYAPLLNLFDSILTGAQYPSYELVSAAVQLAKIHRYGSYSGYSIKKEEEPDIALTKGILKFNILSLLLCVLGVMTTPPADNAVPCEDLPEDLEKWFELMRYNDLRKGLFLLGYLVGEVGTAQWKKGDEKKSILDRLDYKGMGKERVMELAVSILKSLRDYRLLNSSNEKIYYYMKALLDRCVDGLVKDPLENVFYILSGYSFATYSHIRRGGGGE